MVPARLRMALIRCRVRSIPARLSSPKSPNSFDHVLDVAVGDGDVVQDDLTVDEARLGLAAEVEHHLEEVPPMGGSSLGGRGDPGWKGIEEKRQLLLPGRAVFASRTDGSSARNRSLRLQSSLRGHRYGVTVWAILRPPG